MLKSNRVKLEKITNIRIFCSLNFEGECHKSETVMPEQIISVLSIYNTLMLIIYMDGQCLNTFRMENKNTSIHDISDESGHWIYFLSWSWLPRFPSWWSQKSAILSWVYEITRIKRSKAYENSRKSILFITELWNMLSKMNFN